MNIQTLPLQTPAPDGDLSGATVADCPLRDNRTMETGEPQDPATGARAEARVDCDIQVGCDRRGQTFVVRQYTAYPFRLSQPFRLDQGNAQRAYLYLMNAAPGLFGGDRLSLNLTVGRHASLYFTEQAATKVHTMPATPLAESFARLHWQITVEAHAHLELVPEPLILYTDAQLAQSTTITLHPTSTLFLSEIIVPGRLARSEYYQFRAYHNRLRVCSPEGALLFGEGMKLVGQSNPFKTSVFVSHHPLMANIFVVVPQVNLEQLSCELEQRSSLMRSHGLVGLSPLPNCNGLLIRVMGDRIDQLQTYIHSVLAGLRLHQHQLPLPTIPK